MRTLVIGLVLLGSAVAAFVHIARAEERPRDWAFFVVYFGGVWGLTLIVIGYMLTR